MIIRVGKHKLSKIAMNCHELIRENPRDTWK